MAQVILNALTDSNSAYGLLSKDADLAVAYAGPGIVTGNVGAGAYFYNGNVIYQGFLKFDTSSINPWDTVTAVTLFTYNAWNNFQNPGTILQARQYDWTSPLTANAATWRTPTESAGDTLLATHDASATFPGTGNMTWTSESAFVDNINKGGITSMYITSNQIVAEYSPNTEWSILAHPEYDESIVPKLTVTYNDGTAPVSSGLVLGANF